MSQHTQNLFKEFRAELKRDFPKTKVELSLFSSGASMMDVSIGDETFVIEALANQPEVGVSRMSTATFGWEGCENVFSSFSEAKDYVFSLLKTNYDSPRPPI